MSNLTKEEIKQWNKLICDMSDLMCDINPEEFSEVLNIRESFGSGGGFRRFLDANKNGDSYFIAPDYHHIYDIIIQLYKFVHELRLIDDTKEQINDIWNDLPPRIYEIMQSRSYTKYKENKQKIDDNKRKIEEADKRDVTRIREEVDESGNIIYY